MPNLSVAKRGFTTKFDLIEIVNSILYKLKSGCQWRMLPVGHLFTGAPPTWNTVFHLYRKWSKAGEWKSTFTEILSQNKDKVDLSLSHTPAYRGGEMVAYQGRKKRKTTNALFLSDRNGLPLALRQRQIGFPMQNYYKIKKSVKKKVCNFLSHSLRLTKPGGNHRKVRARVWEGCQVECQRGATERM